MSHTVTKSPPVLVPPAGPTPSCMLSLSSIDMQVSNLNVDFISVFSHGEQPANRIKEAFAKALMHYYPVAGRITWMKKDVLLEPIVNCTGEGIWFVEAVANCTLAHVKYFEMPYIIPKDEMLPRPPAGVELENQILMAQITEFMCGAFSVGIWFNHKIFDGEGAAQFLKAVGEMARGLSEPTVKSVWSRQDVLYPPLKLSDGPIPKFTAFKFTTSVVDISLDCINKSKDLFRAETGQTCTTFDVVTAMIFKSRVKAINLAQKDEVSLLFPASTRRLLRNMLPSIEGYYGNCMYGVEFIKTSEEINTASLIEVIALVKHSKEALSIEFKDWMDGRSHKYLAMPSYGKLVVSDWRRVGFNEIDYGWGEPDYVLPYNEGFNLLGSVIILKPPAPKQGVRLILRCVEDDQKSEFWCELERVQMM